MRITFVHLSSTRCGVCLIQRKRKLDTLNQELKELQKKAENNEEVLEEVNKGKEESVSNFTEMLLREKLERK